MHTSRWKELLKSDSIRRGVVYINSTPGIKDDEDVETGSEEDAPDEFHA
jgi:hypothetical protein